MLHCLDASYMFDLGFNIILYIYIILQKQYQDFDSLANSNHYWMPISRTKQNEVVLVDLYAARRIVFFGISSPGRAHYRHDIAQYCWCSL